MQLKTFLAALVVATMTVSVATASPPPGKGHGKRHAKHDAAASSAPASSRCKPRSSLVLKGEYVSGSADATGVGSFAMVVKKANKHGRAFANVQLTIKVDASTKLRRDGHAELSDFVAGDRLNVQVRRCTRGQAGTASTAELLARRVVGHPAAQEDDADDEQTETTTSTTTATTTTS